MIWDLVFVSTGSFIYWLASGLKGKFDDFMSRYTKKDRNYFKNWWTGFLVVVVFLFNLFYLFL